jgi:hypothetical protein
LTVTTGRRLEAVTRLMPGGIRSTEGAKRLGIDGADTYRLLFAGVLDGDPRRDGVVYFDEASIEAYLERHGFSCGGRTFYRIFYRIGRHGESPADTQRHPRLGKAQVRAQDGTRRHRPSLITRRSRVQIPPPPPREGPGQSAWAFVVSMGASPAPSTGS